MKSGIAGEGEVGVVGGVGSVSTVGRAAFAYGPSVTSSNYQLT